IAKNLLTRFKTINNIINADTKILKEIKGVSNYTISYLKILKELFIKLSFENIKKNDTSFTEVINTTESAYKLFKFLIGSSKDEKFAVIYLDNANKILNYEIIANGTVNEVTIYPRNLIEKILQNNAMGIIISHNHPTKELEPSQFDKDLTENIKNSLMSIDVSLLDHLIVSDEGFFSFAENQLL
ncbi:MAG: hypothetical protein LBF97_01070, partial [Elusimicrobiota bacterium]|nr:hypothetical protein [Elusimicrobiota bacterium]